MLTNFCSDALTTAYRSLFKALFGKFFASPEFGFTKISSTSHWDGGAFVKADSNRCGPLRSLSVDKKDSYLLEVNALSFAKGYGELHARFISQRSGWIMFQTSAT
jgi:hypothetical protein